MKVFADDTLGEICATIGDSESISCEETARKKYWLALSKYFDNNDAGAIHKAGIMGNIAVIGDFNPVSWEWSTGIDESGNFVNEGGWGYYYNLNNGVGVGGFVLSYGLNTYLHYINDNAPELITYFSNPQEYSFSFFYHESDFNYDPYTHNYGDELLEKIGNTDFEKLVNIEVEYVIERFMPETVTTYKNTNFSTPSDAAVWWATNYEGIVPNDDISAQLSREAEKAYDDFKNLTVDNEQKNNESNKDPKVSGDQNDENIEVPNTSGSTKSGVSAPDTGQNTGNDKDITNLILYVTPVLLTSVIGGVVLYKRSKEHRKFER